MNKLEEVRIFPELKVADITPIFKKEDSNTGKKL